VERRRASLLLLGAPALTLVSLYLPWRDTSCDVDRYFATGTCGPRVDGWSSVGEVAALCSVLLVVLAGLALVRPHLAERLPLGQSALALAFFTIAVFAQSRNEAARGSLNLAYGAYLGIAGAALALLAALALRRADLSQFLAGGPRASLLAGAGLLLALLLPWIEVAAAVSPSGGTTVDTLGIALAAGVPAALLTVRLLAVGSREAGGSRHEAAVVAAAVLVFVGGAVAINALERHRYGAWIGLAFAVALLGLVLAERPRPSFTPPRSAAAVSSAGALALLAVSLFLPWQRACYPGDQAAQLGLSGRCVSGNGWRPEGSVALLLALAVVAVVLALGVRELSRTELAVGLALMVATLGFQLETGEHAGAQFDIGYGAFAGFVAAAVLVGVALAGVGLREVDWSRRGTVVAAGMLAAAYVAAVVVPWWDVTSSAGASESARLTWLTIAAALVAVRLAGRWLTRLSREAVRENDELVVLPLVLGVLVAIDVVRFGVGDISWHSALLGCLAVALLVLGRVERGGF
jgi:hypothetical protein